LNNGQVYTCGNNQYGQLGRPDNIGTQTPNPIFKIINPNVGKVKQISCGGAHTAILLTNGDVYTCGNNDSGQLGRIKDGIYPINPEFKIIDSNVGKVKQISCGLYHTAILLNNGQVYTCGYNQYGQLGRTPLTPINPEFKIIDSNVGKVKQISCGGAHTAILLNNGQVYTCGNNDFGQLGRLKTGIYPNPKFEQIDPNVGKVKQISCGGEHTAILLNNGQVYTCGNNDSGQLGRIKDGIYPINPEFKIIDSNVGKVKQISCGLYHTAILLNNGQVYTCGNNEFGQLGRLTDVIYPNPKFEQIDRTKIKNIKFFLLSIGCVSNSVLALPY